MKAIIHILTALLAMNITISSAGNPGSLIIKIYLKSDKISFHDTELAPVTPKEALFNEVEPQPLMEITRLAPIAPREATFEDLQPDFFIPSISPVVLQKMVPVTPKEADFEESPAESSTGTDLLAPVSPPEAAFEE
jgi:hypothetical protein